MGEMEEKVFDCVVIGGGPAGMSAALYAKRGNLNTAIIDETVLGGQPVNYLEIENYPGFPTIEGWELSEKFEQHIEKFGIEKFTNEEIESVDLMSAVKSVKTKKAIYKAKTIIIATGANPAKLGIKGESEFIGRGVSYCAVCDGGFYKDKTVVVVGGGNSALEEAMYLTKFAKKVYIMVRRDVCRADRIICKRAENNPKIEFVFLASPLEIMGNKKVSSVKYHDLKTDEIKEIQTDGVFPYIGIIPNTKHFNGQIIQDENGFIKTDESMRTSEVGVFAAGDVRTTPLRQVVTAAADGAVAGHFAVKYIEEKMEEEKEILTTRI